MLGNMNQQVKVGTDSYHWIVDGGEGFKIVFDKDYRNYPLILTYYLK